MLSSVGVSLVFACLTCSVVDAEVLIAKKGKFFVHKLRGNKLFNESPPPTKVHYLASVAGLPDLPKWMHLAQLEDSSSAFLYGTPGVRDESVNITILARNLENYVMKSSELAIELEHVKHFSIPPKQISEIWIRNFDAWDLLSDSRLFRNLQKNVRKAFGDVSVRPYVRNLKPATAAGARIPLTREKVGVIAYVAPRKRPYTFPRGVRNLAKGVQLNRQACSRNKIIGFDLHFAPEFLIDWCSFRMYNYSDDKISEAMVITKTHVESQIPSESLPRIFHIPPADSDFRSYRPTGLSRDYFLDWVLIAAIPLAVLMLLLLCLTAVFFGGREGQHWRDYKTPQPQLAEYVHLRQSQFKLRNMSNVRSSVAMPQDTQPPPYDLRTRLAGFARNRLGKQTVGEAAEARGDPLEPYEENNLRLFNAASSEGFNESTRLLAHRGSEDIKEEEEEDDEEDQEQSDEQEDEEEEDNEDEEDEEEDRQYTRPVNLRDSAL